MSLLFSMLSRRVITLPEQLFPFSLQGLETDDRTVSLAACFEFLFDFRTLKRACVYVCTSGVR